MRRRWIVDASNVMGARPDGWWRDRPAALRRLLDELAQWRAANGEPVLMVCDGYPSDLLPEGTHRQVHVRYAHSSGRDAADHTIAGVVEQHDEPSSLVVVTSDRELSERVRSAGASTEGAGRFLQRISEPPTGVTVGPADQPTA